MDENANDDADSVRLRQPLAVDADFRRCIELAPIGVCIADEQARILFANPQLCRQSGYTRDELLQLRVGNFFPPEFQEQGLADFEQLVRTGSINVQQPFVSKDGERGWVSVSATKLKDGQFLGYISDISNLKAAQDELLLKESAIANSISGVAIVDLADGSVAYANDSFLRILGYEREADVLGRTPLEFVRDPAFVQSVIETVLQTGKWSGELTALKSDGSFVELEVFGAAIEDDVGQITFMVGTIHDITDRKRAEALLQSSEERLRQFIDQVPVGVAMLDHEMRYLACSQRWLSDARLEGRDITGESHYDLFPNVSSEIRECHARCLKGDVWKFDRITLTHPDGSSQHLRCEMHPWFAAPEKIGGIVLFSEDVTERHVAEEQTASLREQLAHASRVGTMGELAAGIAHELNQPLMAVHMYAQTAASLRKRADGAAELEQKVDEALEKVAEQSLRAGEIVQRMRAFIGKRQPQLAECRVNELVDDVLDLLHSPLTTENVNVQLEQADSLPEVQADSIQIQQVLVNLIQNAIDAMSAEDQQPRNLRLGTRHEDGDVVVSVADSGPGLPEAALLQVFDPFHSTKPAGMGLGLPICRTLVEAHGGTIVARANRDAGAVFEFRLPVLTKGTRNA
jgi:PAS domain S-box-containing protein